MEVFSILWSPFKNDIEYPIGILVYNKVWYFKYNKEIIKKAMTQGFRPFPDLLDIEKDYISDILFPTFRNRYLERDNIDVMKNQLGQLVSDRILIKYIK